MRFQDAIVSVFTQYATFSGRARRSEYWYFVLFNLLVTAVLGFLGTQVGSFFSVLSGLYSLGALIPGLALFWRRLHDTGRSGLCILFGLIPLVGAIILIVTKYAGDAPVVFGTIGASFGPICGAMAADYILSGFKWNGPRAGFNPAGWISWFFGFVVGAYDFFLFLQALFIQEFFLLLFS